VKGKLSWGKLANAVGAPVLSIQQARWILSSIYLGNKKGEDLAKRQIDPGKLLVQGMETKRRKKPPGSKEPRQLPKEEAKKMSGTEAAGHRGGGGGRKQKKS